MPLDINLLYSAAMTTDAAPAPSETEAPPSQEQVLAVTSEAPAVQKSPTTPQEAPGAAQEQQTEQPTTEESLQSKVDKGEVLSADEVKQYAEQVRRQEQSTRDRQQAAEQQQAQRQQEIQYLSRTKESGWNAISEAVANENSQDSPRWDIVGNKLHEVLGQVESAAQLLALRQAQHALSAHMVSQIGPNPEVERTISRMNVQQVVEAALALGKPQGDMVTRKDADARAKSEHQKGFDEAAAKYGQNGKSPPSGSVATGFGGWSTKEQARNLHAEGKLSSFQMKRINADPSIPEGYGR